MNLIELAKRLADDVRPGLKPQEIEYVDDFNDVGEEGLAADWAMGYAIDNKYPVSRELVEKFIEIRGAERAQGVLIRDAAA